MNANLIEIDDTRAVEITICTHAETVCDGLATEGWRGPATLAAVKEAQRAMWAALKTSVAASEDRTFAHWHGGCHSHADLRDLHVVADLYTRDLIEDEDDREWGEWEWAGSARRNWTADQVTQIEAVIDAMAAAMETTLIALERELERELETRD